MSTAVLASVAFTHTCCTPSKVEADVLREYLKARDIPECRFIIGSSTDTLPAMNEVFDLFFIDGCHGFPVPILDWFYGARLLRPGGILVLDDVQLPGVAALVRFLDRDDRWHRFPVQGSWVAYERLSEGSLLENWPDQPFFGAPDPLWEVIRDRGMA